MENGPLIFIGIGIAIIVFAWLIVRLTRRSIRREMPGGDPRNNSTFWYGSGGSGDFGGDGGN